MSPGKVHSYRLRLRWTGDRGAGTTDYRAYGRDHEISAAGRPAILGSSDPAFRGDRERWNPEELLVAALAQCHLLAYLHLCVQNDIVVVAYQDEPTGEMVQDATGDGGQFRSVTLHPTVTVAAADQIETALALHHEVPAVCFIARSVNFPVRHEPTVVSVRS